MKALPRIACAVLAIALPALSSAQAPKMADCERQAQAADLNAGQRQAFIKQCMSGAPAAKPKAMSPQEARAACERKAQAAELNAGQRQAFINQCMTGAPAPKANPATPQQKIAECERKAQAAELKGNQRRAFVNQCVKS
jgi:hypothetical protein